MANTTPTGSTPAGTGSTPTTPAPSPSDKNVSSVKDFQKNITELDREKFNQAQAALASAQALLNKFADIARDPRGAAIAAAKQAASDAIKNSPLYKQLDNIMNNIELGNLKDLLGLDKIKDLAKSLNVVIPPIRFPVTNENLDKIIGIAKQLKELEAQLRAFAIKGNTGLPAALTDDAFKNMMNDIRDIMSTSKDNVEALKRLEDAGYKIISDPPGTIFEDAAGNKIVDFSNGLGPIGTSLGLLADLNKAWEDVKGRITAPMSNNQALAMASYSNHIGAENFLNSDVLTALNELAYAEVPRLLMGWVMGSPPGGVGAAVFRQDYYDRRLYEAELFQTPDDVDISPPPGVNPGELTFAQLAAILELRRTSYIEQKIREFGSR
jgi:hypothetical protein